MSVQTIFVSAPFAGDYAESISACLAIGVVGCTPEGKGGEGSKKNKKDNLGASGILLEILVPDQCQGRRLWFVSQVVSFSGAIDFPVFEEGRGFLRG